MKKVSRLRQTAYHEAGHVVARYFLHLPFKYVTINKRADSLGHITYSYPKSFDPEIDDQNYKTRIRIEKEIMADFAGHAVEFILTKRHNWRGASHDDHSATNLALYYCGSTKQTGAFLDWLWIRTIEWFKNPLYWMCVKVVTNKLIAKNTLKALEVRDIIKQSINSRFNSKPKKS